ncbi:hypothetical protein L228DRAFT_247998 [Xylona heveae TC161]|uniref:Uncharacterized protein n=1 Tax=Xylona heveae (strain CBS 132557 / TC161) TaxID=1328760 RepID=A0A165GLD7_XYLHT|nr:hypothetical protein L228DRAFT_247998 [Xylona heveae TC161]KZF22332.1 hypothetical protein L228DRAFT_247998 [Xylona heveae TC161]
MDHQTMTNMNGFYLPLNGIQHPNTSNNKGDGMVPSSMSQGFGNPMMGGGQSFEHIMYQNHDAVHRRDSSASQYPAAQVSAAEQSQRVPMLGFGSGQDGDLNGFQFDPTTADNDAALSGTMMSGVTSQPTNVEASHPSSGELALVPGMPNLEQSWASVPSVSAFQSPFPGAAGLNFDMAAGFPAMNMPMAMDFSTGQMGRIGVPMNSLDSYGRNDFHPPINKAASIQRNFPVSGPGEQAPHGSSATHTLPINASRPPSAMGRIPAGPFPSTTQSNLPNTNFETSNQLDNNHLPNPSDGIPALDGSLDHSRHSSIGQNNPNMAFSDDNSPDIPELAAAAEAATKPSQYHNIYSSSGFDMLGVLTRVATRPDPEINIGAVDMSCAFVVCDCTQHDLPIVYCSEMFERLTGYSKHEILGRNCRFLQAPDGKVQSGIKRKYVDDDSVLYLKNMIIQGREAQISLINYRKGGQPFMNLLTMIPIRWDSEDYRYFVGFQVDLVEQPNSVTDKNPDGSYAINYKRGFLPRYVFQTPENTRHHSELGQTISPDEVATVLASIGKGESELSKRIWDKVLLENTDDVIHVLSLKGLFLYLSPSSRKVLEYDASELVGAALSSVCHPSDIVPVTRELKEAAPGVSVSVVFRIRRKYSGYTWFEAHGSLHVEQGKGRKCIILAGRERPVYTIYRNDLLSTGGTGDNELWTKLSTSGMFLFVSSNVRALLDRQPLDLVGTSVQSLMRPDSRAEFGRVLEVARTGKRAQLKHEMQNRRGQVLQAHTTIYPGDAGEGQKPTFLVAQTKMLKLSRFVPSSSTNRSQLSPRADQASSPSPASSSAIAPSGSSQRQSNTPQSSMAPSHNDNVWTAAGGSALAIGSQDVALASEENVFDELKTTRSTSWQFELRQMEKRNRLLAEELQSLLAAKKKRKRRKGAGQLQKDCANCHTRTTPEWRRGPSGHRDLCNSCGLRWAKQNGRISPRTSSQQSDKQSVSSTKTSPLVPIPSSSTQGITSMAPPEKPAIPGTSAAEAQYPAAAQKEAAAAAGYDTGIASTVMPKNEPS